MGSNTRYENKLICGVGISDKGKYKAYVNGKNTQVYDRWQKMIARCYYDNSLKRQTTYKDCYVEDYLLSFQNFAEWYENEVWTDELILNLDKDILTHGKEKVYSRDTILLVDKNINSLFTRRQNERGEFPIGISKYFNKYKVMCNDHTKPIYLGLYNTIDEAFLIYKEYKENLIKQVANEYKQKYPNFPNKLYNAMYEYEVFIDD